MQILVLGMHRSGTSMVSRLLNMMGAYFAPEGAEMPAHEMNPKGFWERRDVNELCIKLLASAGCDWHRLSRFKIDALPTDAVTEFKRRAKEIILGMDGHRPWFLKEPRFCVLAPLWLELLEFPVCIIVYRSPLEVARSLEMRDGFPLAFGVALWERYNTALLNATLGRRRLQVNHADLMSHPVATARKLAQGLKALDVRGLRSLSSEEIRAFIDPSLYRAKETEMSAPSLLSAAQRKLQDAFQDGKALLATKPIRFSAAAQQELIRHDEAVAVKRKSAELEARNAALAAEVISWKSKAEQSEKASAQIRQDLEPVQRKLAAAQTESAEKLRLDSQSQLQQAAEAKKKNAEVEARNAALSTALAEWKRKAEENEKATAQLRQDFKGLQENLAATRTELAERLLANRDQASAAKKTITALQAREDLLRKETDIARAELAVHQAELASQQRLAEARETELQSQAAEEGRLRQELEMRATALMESQQEIKRLAAEAALLQREVAARIEERKARDEALQKRTEIIDRLETELKEFATELERERSAAAALQADLRESRLAAAARSTELTDTQAQLAATRKQLLESTDELNVAVARNNRRRSNIRIKDQLHNKSVEVADLTNRAKALAAHIAASNQTAERAIFALEAQLAELQAQFNEVSEKNRLLGQAFDKIEEYFLKLRASRSFRFMVYTARRLGLVSRTPRRCVEAIKDQFRKTHKALEETQRSGAAALEKGRGNAASARGTAVADCFFPAALTFHSDSRQSDKAKIQQVATAVSLRKAACARHAISLPAASDLERASVCFIVLHHSGENHLQNLFTSFLKVNTHALVEFSIVLHACKDRSREVIAEFQDRLQIKVTDCPENRSFSCSNNRAAEQTNADYLVFLNDDIIFHEEITGELLRCLQDPRTGLVGLRLLYPPGHGEVGCEIQHAGIKFRADPQHFFHRPFNLGAPVQIADTPWVPEEFPAVTAAVVACRRRDFLAAGGFFEGYLYGYEDVDLSLSFRRRLGLRAVSANQISCIHNESATGRLEKNEAIRQRRLNNIGHLVRRHGWYLRRKILEDKLAGNAFFSDNPLTVAFAVTEATPSTAAGDFFSASELAEACAREFGWRIRYLSRGQDWYDLKDVDVLVVLLDAYELTKIRDAKPDLIKVAWLRNWFDRWTSHADFDQYDLFLCSSFKSAQWLQEKHRKSAWVFPLATNPARFIDAKAEPRLASDYCFTGSYWAVEREIGTAVRPEKLDGYTFGVFGKGWETHPGMSPYARGFIPYTEIPRRYASTRIVVDDANHVTKDWGSVNSRVFDALVAGALVITNGDLGAAELFDEELPAYHSPEELHTLLVRYLGDETERRALTDRLCQRVLSRHTYRHRARTLKRILLSRARNGYRIALKIGAPTRRQIHHWGDYHFALSIGRCLARHGHSFRIDCLDEWNRVEAFGDDVVIVLRGLSRYQPKPSQINFMWNISHPDKIQDEEYNQFDHVFVASQSHAQTLAKRLQTTVSALLQCTDPDVFYPDPNPDVPAEDILFVGNSRKQYREAVRHAVEAGMPVGVYGTHWPMFIPESHIRGEYIDNSVLRQHYSRAGVVLNDHWPTMRENGFASNRIFDAAAAGAFVLTDTVKGIEELFGDDLVTYGSKNEFHERIRHYLAHPEERRVKAERLQTRVLGSHTFAHRAEVILDKIKEIDQRKRNIEELGARPRGAVSAGAAGAPLSPRHASASESIAGKF